MNSSRKYAGLPDLDIAPDIYETPELTDDTSTRPTSTTLRSESRASSYNDPNDDEPAHIDRHRLDPDGARTHFLPARVDARDVDFSDRIDSKRKSYHTSNRRRRNGENGEEELGDLSDEDGTAPESLQRRIARLQREAEELKVEVSKQKEIAAKGAEEGLDEDALNSAITTISTLNAGSSVTAERQLAQRLSTTLKGPPPTTKGAKTNSHTPSPSYTVSYAPTYTPQHNLAKVTSFDTRLALLETLLGISSLPLATSSVPPSKPLLPTLSTLDRNLTLLTTTTPSTLAALAKKTHQLTLDAEKLTAARKAAKAAQEALQDNQSDDYPNAQKTGDRPATENILEDPEQVSKINALYGTLPTIESLAPLLPALLERLRSLRQVHADAAGASQSLAEVERRQAEMAKEIQGWREGLEKVEGVMREGEERMRGNMGVVEGWVRELEVRIGGLGT